MEQAESHLKLTWQAASLWPPRLALQATLDQLDVDRYVAPQAGDSLASAGMPSPQNGASDQNGFAGTLAGEVKAGKLRAQGMWLENLSARFAYDGDRLTVSAHAAPLSEKRRRR
jgi:hypothetical protein